MRRAFEYIGRWHNRQASEAVTSSKKKEGGHNQTTKRIICSSTWNIKITFSQRISVLLEGMLKNCP